jgi:thioredoxin-like negative regulator of GroEL
MLAPVLEELAKEYNGKIYIYKVDAEKEAELSKIFHVQVYPTLFFDPMTGNLQMAQGALPKAQLKELIDNILLSNQAPTPPPPPLLKKQ